MRKGVRKKYWEYFIVLNLICGCVIYAIYIGTSNLSSSASSTGDYYRSRPASDDYYSAYPMRKRESNWTRILFWTGYFDSYHFSAFGIDQQTFRNCPVKCHVTFDKRLLPLSDGVVFHVRDIAKVGMPPYHRHHQIWIFYLQESASNTRLDLRSYANVFNWTMSYRLDSDVYHPYARVVRKPSASPLTPRRSLTSTSWTHRQKTLPEKSKLVAWVVSNCFTHSNRESLVQELQKFIPIDIYGYCGTLKCPGETNHECYAHLAKSYKFYLAFENSLCIDYVTEKFFDSLRHDMVPVVYGRANYSALAPPGSYIDSREFESPEALASYLHYLDLHPEEYSKYFAWKEAYDVLPSEGWCSLCTKLKTSSGAKSYFNIWKWWHLAPDGSTGRRVTATDRRDPACLPVPNYPSESWFNALRKKYFILP